MAIDSNGLGLGIVLTPDVIIGVQIRHAHGRMEIVRHGSIATPDGAVEGTAVRDPARVGQAIRSLRSKMGAQGKSASIALLAPGYQMRTLRLPDVPAGERRILVRGEMEEASALPIGGGAFDFLWIAVPAPEGRRQVDACVYYTTDAEIDEMRETARQSALRLDAVEPASIAMIRAYVSGMSPRQPIAFLCASERYSDLCIHDGNRVRHLRRIPAGYGESTRLAAMPFQQELPVVPTSLLGETLPTEFSPLSERSAAVESEQAANPSMGFLTTEVSRSLAFYAREYPDAPRPQTLIVLGTVDAIHDVEPFLSDALTIPVSSRDPLATLGLPSAPVSANVGEQGLYLAAIGAALGEAEPSLPLVNIALQEKVAGTRRRAPAILMAGMAGSAMWMVLSAVAAIGLTFLESSESAESARLTEEIARIKTEQAPKLIYQEMQSAADVLRAKSQIPAQSVLGSVAAATPPGVALGSLKTVPDGLVVLDGKAQDTGSMQQFVTALDRSQALGTPRFQMMKKDDREGITFRIACAMAGVQKEKPAEPAKKE